jgi:putative ABC transport system ATP-binding protein
MIEIQNITKVYQMGETEVRALDGVSLKIEDGEWIAITGPSGSGKSTLMAILGCLDSPTSGSYQLDGIDVAKMRDDQLAAVRNKKIGFVFQQFNLLSRTSALENVALPLLYATGNHQRDRAKAALAAVGLSDRLGHRPNELSGGQQQRVAIARALVTEPSILLADEPTGNLDSKTAETIFALFNDLVEQGKTVIIVTHDSGLARRAHRTALLADGEIVNEYVAKALPTLTPAQLLAATHKLQPRHYEAGSMILAEGKNSEAFYVIAKGTVEVVLPRRQQSDVVALELGPGKYFGEMEFFHDRRNRASIRASESCAVEVLSLDYEALSSLLGESEPTREALHQAADRHEKENVEWREGES